MPVVGFLTADLRAASNFEPFRRGLVDAGFLEGQNLAIEFRWADGDYGRLPALVADLVARRVSVIIANPGLTALVAQDAPKTIPIVFSSGVDPVQIGLVRVPDFNTDADRDKSILAAREHFENG